MITKATSEGFKGLDFSQDLKQYNLVVGPMGVGKSAISDAIMLAINGYVPCAGKTNQATMDTFSGNGKLFVKVDSNGKSFERRFVRSPKGTVSQKFRIGERTVSKEAFISGFAEAGKPAILNLSEFLELSDQKKIDLIFDLYPPKEDIKGLVDDIEKHTNHLNDLHTSIKTQEKVIEKLTLEKAEIELPSGTLAEITRDIERTTAEVKLARKNLRDQEKREAEQKGKEKAEAKAAETEKQKEVTTEKEPHKPQLGGDPGYTARNSEDFQDTVPRDFEAGETINPLPTRRTAATDPKESIKAIINIMQKAGCTSCVAMLMAKKELRKF